VTAATAERGQECTSATPATIVAAYAVDDSGCLHDRGYLDVEIEQPVSGSRVTVCWLSPATQAGLPTP